jgi:uncharacterized protein YbaP (TraB family)
MNKSIHNLDTFNLRYEADLVQLSEMIPSFSFHSIKYFINHIRSFLEVAKKSTLPSLNKDMKGSVFYIYHRGQDATEELHQVSLSASVIKRNQEWFPQLEKYIQLNGTFVAVGLAHLLGPHGILEWAQGKRYTIKRSKH